MPSPRSDRRHAPWLYVATTLAWTWTLWGLLAVTEIDWQSGAGSVIFLLGGLGPALTATMLVGLGRADESVRAFWRRCLDPRLVSLRWWMILVGVAVLPAAAARLLSAPRDEGLLVTAPTLFLVVGLLAGVAEEPGWRGYAQQALRRRWTALTAGLVVGLVWGAWHLPLFFVAGTYQHGLDATGRLLWVGGILVGTVLYAWLYEATSGATVIAVAFHALLNLTGEVLVTDRTAGFVLLGHAALALGVVLITGPSLTRGGERTDSSTSSSPSTRHGSDGSPGMSA